MSTTTTTNKEDTITLTYLPCTICVCIVYTDGTYNLRLFVYTNLAESPKTIDLQFIYFIV